MMLLVAAMVLVLISGVLVFNLGYLVASKVIGYEVTEFSIGYGKELTTFTIGKTAYSLRAIPMGGFVRFNREDEISWRSFFFCFAGPVADIIFAFTILTALYMIGYTDFGDQKSEPVLDYVLPGSPAAVAGLQAGDRIMQVGDLGNPRWGDVIEEEASSTNEPIALKIRRGDTIVNATVTPDKDQCSDVGFAGWSKHTQVRVIQVSPKSPAAEAGVKQGDVIVKANAGTIDSLLGFGEIVRNSGGKPLELFVLRGGSAQLVHVAPIIKPGDGAERFTIGITIGSNVNQKIRPVPFGEALRSSFRQNLKSGYLIVKLMKNMVARRPIPSVTHQRKPFPGRGAMVELGAAIFLNLGIFNVLPIPILPGGAILLIAIQLLTGRELSLNVKERVYQVAFVFLVLFAVLVIYNDVSKLSHDAKGSRPQTQVIHFFCSSPEV